MGKGEELRLMLILDLGIFVVVLGPKSHSSRLLCVREQVMVREGS